MPGVPLTPCEVNDNEAWPGQMPGVRCPTCEKNGKLVWVIPGRLCGYCGTACGVERNLSNDPKKDSFIRIYLLS